MKLYFYTHNLSLISFRLPFPLFFQNFIFPSPIQFFFNFQRLKKKHKIEVRFSLGKYITDYPMMPAQQHQLSIPTVQPSSTSPCAACKFLRRKCQPDCVFAPYFPPDNPQKFVHVHRVFGASNVSKILNDLPASHREDAVNSLAYEADMRLRDPVYGCVGVISILQRQLRQLQMDLSLTKLELAKYQQIRSGNEHNLNLGQFLNGGGSGYCAQPNNLMPARVSGIGGMVNGGGYDGNFVGNGGGGGGGQFLKMGSNNGGEERVSLVGP